VSGSKQHFIPRVLLKGFQTGAKGKIPKVWVFERGEEPYQPAITGVGAERFFYSELSGDGSTTLDDEITDYENNRFQGLLTELRAGAVGGTVDAAVAAEVVAHLVVRNAHFRASLAHGVRRVAEEALVFIGDTDAVMRSTGLDARVPNARFLNAFEKHLDSEAAFAKLGLPKPLLQQIAFALARENIPALLSQTVPAMRREFGAFALGADALAKQTHSKALGGNVAPVARMASLAKLRWVVAHVPTGLILPDCVALMMDANGEVHPLTVSEGEGSRCVFMPINTDRLLVGVGDGASPNLADFNRWAAGCSRAFFVAATNTDEHRLLSDQIGERATLIIDQAVSEGAARFRVGPTTEPHDPFRAGALKRADRSDGEPLPAMPAICSLSFLDCADEATAQRIANAVGTVVKVASQTMPLGRLDGFTFARDYPAALRDLDRGFPATAALETTSVDYAQGVAMAPLVLREGQLKSRIVARDYIGQALIGEDEEAFKLACHALMYELAEVGCVELVEQALPGAMLGRIEDPFENTRYAPIHNAWLAYFAGRGSAEFRPDADEGYADTVRRALEALVVRVPTSRVSYRYHDDLDRLMSEAIGAVGDVLQFGGAFLGHCAGIERLPASVDVELNATLNRLGLERWFDDFRNDLELLWERRGEWASFEEFLILNRHVDRLLWPHGIFLWRTPEGLGRIDVPWTPDLRHLPRAWVAWRLRDLRDFAKRLWRKTAARDAYGAAGRAGGTRDRSDDA